jgi:cell wall-associated protease
MKKLILFFALSASLAQAQILPVDNSVLLVEDELFAYQWGLLNQGQTLIREKDDIHNLPMKGVKNKDIGWNQLVGNFAERRPIVAVLDSGVDITHPELQGNLWTNEAECGKDPKKDNDNNKLPGDCNGWNFTENLDSDEAKDVTDMDGHGTHIAGIIAALNNGTGMVGVTPNALIMPIKVMRDSNSKSDVQSSDAFARGIIYAVDSGADVINMSLGWPRSLETKALRDAVMYALNNGVPIVAAAGNNNSAEPLFPCAYDGVICVAASTVNGKFAGFSNYGGHVDTIAPGDGILGLNPILLEPDFFSVPGYEMRSGTSQAAPMVTAMVAALKAKNKDITIDQLFAKLYHAAPNTDKEKYILGGEATWEAINADIVTPVVRPIFKKVRQVVFRSDANESKLNIPVRNFGTESGRVDVRITSLSKSIEFNASSQSLENLRPGEAKDLSFDVSIKSINLESSVSIKVSITTNGKEESYINEIPVVRDLRNEPKLKKSNFIFTDKVLPLGGVKNGELIPLISTVESYGPTKKQDYLLKKTLRDEKRVELNLFTRKGDKFQQLPNQLVFENALNLVNLIRTDLNFDGEEDYLVHILSEKDGKKYFTFNFYDSELKPLWNDFQNVNLTLDLYLESMNDLSFITYDHAKLGKIKVPAFFTTGSLPRVDQNITSWEKPDVTRKKRLYYLEPSNGEFKVRALTTNVWEANVKKELATKWFETVDTEQLLPVSATDAANGKLRVLVSVGLGTKRQLFIHTYDTKTNTHGTKLPQLVLQTDTIDPLINISSTGLINNGDAFFNIYDRTRAKLVTTRGEAQTGEYVLRHETETDLIAGHIVSYDLGQKRFSVYQSREELISITTGAPEKRSTRPKLRYSFFSQKLLSEMYYPVAYKRNGELRPALYVDATAVTGNRVYLFEEQNGELISSIRNSVIVPSNCKALNPSFSQTSGTYEFNFLCLEDKEFLIRSYEMN